nr:uncharacterized protein CI109_002495 [Kwoniella shandongensis]KAA5529154.1 hypothetical protein CI109_002495 [Kwoniella shandongensis]
MPDFEIDNLTVLLLSLLAALGIYHRFFSTPQPLVHPLLLGKQSEVSAVRKKGETGVYRSWATGQGTPLTVRPANTIKTVQDVVEQPKATSPVTQRCILDVSLTDEALGEILRLLPIGLQLLFPSIANPASPSPILTLLPPSPTSALPLLLLSLSVRPNTPLIILPSPRLLTAGLTSKNHPTPGVVVVHASLLDDVVEQVWEDCRDRVGILIVGDPQKDGASTVKNARAKGLEVHWWEEIWDVAESEKGEQVKLEDPHFNDVHSYFYSAGGDGKPVVVKATHLNFTAGMAALLSIFPADKRPSAVLHDTVASAVRLDTPLGMTIALATVWTGASFRLIGNAEPTWDPEEVDHAAELEVLADPERKLPKPTILFISPKHHHALLDRLQYTYEAHPWAPLAARHKTSSIRAGHVDRHGLWDRVLWSGMRENVLGGIAGQRLRGVILVGDAPPPTALGASHLLLSLPLTRLHPSVFSTGPVFCTHFYDLQSPGVSHILKEVDLWKSADKVHSGPPASNVEVRLKGEKVDEAFDAEGTAISGRIWIRGPGILERIDGKGEDQEGWVDIGEHAKVQTNGTFIVDNTLV